jgi:RimJ/RimL family protein N-acetyltransferase
MAAICGLANSVPDRAGYPVAGTGPDGSGSSVDRGRTNMADEPKQVDRLDGGLVTLEPLGPNHAAALFPSVADPEVGRWKLVDQPRSVDELRDLIGGVLTGRRRWSFVIRRRLDGAPIGSTTLARFDWPHRCVENGFTWLDRTSCGQGYNEDTKRLLLAHLFDDLDFARVEWQCDTRNERSAGALARLGFTNEGTLRSRHVPDRHRGVA